MFNLPPPKPKTPREEVIEVLAEGLFTLVIRGDKPNRPKTRSLSTSVKQLCQKQASDSTPK